jgi:hypothetical protein
MQLESVNSLFEWRFQQRLFIGVKRAGPQRMESLENDGGRGSAESVLQAVENIRRKLKHDPA